jgi:cytoskeleton protein RodZ
MSAFGENLRREREMRGVSLDEISFATKISLRFLEAIEREDFSKLPGGIFSRSFIRTYARYLGLDEDRVVAEFQLAAQPQTDFDLHRMAAGNSRFGRPGQKSTLIATAVAIVLLATGYMLYRYSRRAAEAPPPPLPAPVVTSQPSPAPPMAVAPASTLPATADSSAVPAGSVVTGGPSVAGAPGVPSATAPAAAPGTAPNTVPSPLNPSPAGSKPAAGVGPATNPAAPATAAAASAPQNVRPGSETEMALQIASTERAWVAVDADGKTVFQRVLNPNEVQNFHAQKSFEVTTGNAQSVILTLNGQTLKPLGRRGEVKSVHLTRDDLKHTTP